MSALACESSRGRRSSTLSQGILSEQGWRSKQCRQIERGRTRHIVELHLSACADRPSSEQDKGNLGRRICGRVVVVCSHDIWVWKLAYSILDRSLTAPHAQRSSTCKLQAGLCLHFSIYSFRDGRSSSIVVIPALQFPPARFSRQSAATDPGDQSQSKREEPTCIAVEQVVCQRKSTELASQ